MNDRILLVSRMNRDSLEIKRTLEKDGQFEVRFSTTAPEAMEFITKDNTDLLIINLQNFTKNKLELAQDVRLIGYDFPILILAHIITQGTHQIVSELPGTFLLEKPFEIKDLTGLSEKLIVGRPVKQRIFPRYYTNETAKLELFKGGQAIASRIRNLSRGGAFIEYQGPELAIGDVLRLNIDLKQIARHYEVNAKVVWATKRSPWGDDPGIGVEFIKPKDFYQNLLRKM